MKLIINACTYYIKKKNNNNLYYIKYNTYKGKYSLNVIYHNYWAIYKEL